MRQDIADAIGAQLDRHGWTQGRSVNGAGQICGYEALCRALQHTLTGIPAVEHELTSQAARLFPDRSPKDLITFNDHKDTTLEDLRLVIKHCVEE